MNSIPGLYQQMRELAREKRILYSIGTQQPLNLIIIRNIYKIERININHSRGKLRNLRAAYYNDKDGCDVLLNSKLPREARIFSLCHELKHHFCDRNLLSSTIPCLMAYGQEPEIEIAAEVFASEFIWPESNFKISAEAFGFKPSACSAEAIVYFKRATKMPVSYAFIRKSLERLGFIPKGKFADMKFKNLEYSIFGTPFYLRKNL